jgi:hypothetical protein
MTITNTNGRVRKSLAEQIDRLDQILDGLADGLNDAVAMAVKEAVGVAVKEAVKAVFTEVLTNPAVAAKLLGATVQPSTETPKPGRLRLLGAWIGRRTQAVCHTVATLIGTTCQACRTLIRRTGQGIVSVWARVRVLRHFKVQLLTAVAVGTAAGIAAYLAGPWLAAGVSAAGGFAMTLAVHTGIWLRRTLEAPLKAPTRTLDDRAGAHETFVRDGEGIRHLSGTRTPSDICPGRGRRQTFVRPCQLSVRISLRFGRASSAVGADRQKV